MSNPMQILSDFLLLNSNEGMVTCNKFTRKPELKKNPSTVFNFPSLNYFLIMNNLVPFHVLFLDHRQSGRTSNTNRSFIIFN